MVTRAEDWINSFYAIRYYALIILLPANFWEMDVTYKLEFLNNDSPDGGKVLQLLQCKILEIHEI